MKDYTQFAKSMGVVLLALYSAAIVLLFFALPIVVFVPGLALQLLALIPYWAISITKSRSPVSTNLLFFDEVREVNPSLYRELKDASSATKGRAWVSGVKDDVHRSWHFTRYSLLLLAFSVVPVVGPIVSFFGQIVLVTNRLGWNLLSVYTQDCRKMNYRQQKDWMRTYRWLIFGCTTLVTGPSMMQQQVHSAVRGADVGALCGSVADGPGRGRVGPPGGPHREPRPGPSHVARPTQTRETRRRAGGGRPRTLRQRRRRPLGPRWHHHAGHNRSLALLNRRATRCGRGHFSHGCE
jgi:hypothetical protein